MNEHIVFEIIGNVLMGLMCLCLLGWVISFFENYCIPVLSGVSNLTSASINRVANFIAPNQQKPMVSAAPVKDADDADSALLADADKVESILLNQNAVPEVAAEILSIRVGKKARIALRYYRSTKTVARHVNVLDQKLIQSHGRRFVMPALKVNQSWEAEKADLVRKTREDAKQIFGNYDEENRGVQNLTVEPQATEVQTVDPKVSLTKNESSSITEEIPSLKNDSPSTAHADELARKFAKAIMSGQLHWHGKAERTTGNKTFEQYRVDYIDDETKVVESIWGQDLKRAISSCGAERGDRIDIFRMGKRKVESDHEDDSRDKKYMVKFHIAKNLTKRA